MIRLPVELERIERVSSVNKDGHALMLKFFVPSYLLEADDRGLRETLAKLESLINFPEIRKNMEITLNHRGKGPWTLPRTAELAEPGDEVPEGHGTW